MALLHPILYEIPKIFTGKKIYSLSQDLRINDFQFQLQTNELLQITMPECHQGYTLFQHHKSHLTLHNPKKVVIQEFSEFCITLTTSLPYKLLCYIIFLQCNWIIFEKWAHTLFKCCGGHVCRRCSKTALSPLNLYWSKTNQLITTFEISCKLSTTKICRFRFLADLYHKNEVFATSIFSYTLDK